MDKIKLKYRDYSVNVYHKQGKSEEKLVFLHGGGLDHAMLSWEKVIDLMGDYYDIYAIDMLGYGESDKPDITYSIPLYTELLSEILQQLNIAKSHLVGLSLGGAAIIGFSLQYPERVGKIALVSAWGYRSRFQYHALARWYVHSRLNPKSYEWMRKSRKMVRWSIASSFIGDGNKITEELVDRLYGLLQEPDCGMPWISLQRYEMGRGRVATDLAPHLGELKMPVLIVNGEKDPAVPLKSAIHAGEKIPVCCLRIMKGCKHWPQVERPEEFVQVLRVFLS